MQLASLYNDVNPTGTRFRASRVCHFASFIDLYEGFTTQPFTSIDDERLYRYHKLFAESYTTNLRNLEAPWKPVIASVLEAIIKKVCEERQLSIAVQQEQPLAPPTLSAAATDANRTISSKHKGTVYPDVSVLRYLVDPDLNFRTISSKDMGHNAVDYLVCAELKRSPKRADIQQGLKSVGETRKSYKVLSKFLRAAIKQAERQAFVAMNRPKVENSDIILIAASGPFWMWCLAERDSLLHTISKTVEKIMEEAEVERDEDREGEEFDAVDTDDLVGDDESYISVPTIPFDPILPKELFNVDLVLPWSRIVMLDSQASNQELRSIVHALVTVVE